jgi:hypothetical protein
MNKVHWKTSSLSGNNGQCVEVGVWKTSILSGPHDDNCVQVAGAEDGDVLVRDTKDHGDGPVLRFTPAEWRAFIGEPGKGGAKAGEFDLD